MIRLVTDNLREIRAACDEYDVDRLWVFGSAVRDDWNAEKSDVDFIAKFGESERSLFRQHMGLIGQLEDILGVPVHVVDSRSINRPDFRLEVERTKELLHEQSRHAILA